ncbi:hypothetical protein HDU83_008011 [Entophlyctis luteolus]|nr:hypothetical protein HDU83_008011 [Entophlyctis luteolus]KAJ3380919.1 hypothetical protein HDU84_005502 [Entophlyctis sp. JEL0112]
MPHQLRVRLEALGFEITGPFGNFSDELDRNPSIASKVEVYLTVGTLPLPSEAELDRLTSLRLMACLGSGYECFVPILPYLRRRGISATHSPDANTSCVADLCMALVLSCTRRLISSDRFIREGRWTGIPVQTEIPIGLAETRIGILGLGTIGLKVAKRAAAFEMQVGYCNRPGSLPRVEGPAAEYKHFRTPLDLASWCDVLAVCLRADSSTVHIVDRAILEALGPKGFIVNISRGSSIDETALVELLLEGKLAGCGLDVFENEPIVPQALIEMEASDNGPFVVLSPHRAAWTSTSRNKMCDAVISNIESLYARNAVVSMIPELK